MTPNDTNSDTKTTIQTSTPGEGDNVTPNQVVSGNNQGTNRDNQHNTKGKNQKNGGGNQQLIRDHSSKFIGYGESLKVLLSPTKRRGKVQYIKFKESIITHVLANFNYPSDILTLINTGSIPIIPLPTFTTVMTEYVFTNNYPLTTEGKVLPTILLTDEQK